MAKATISVQSSVVVTLVLSEEEAQTLYDITGFIGGNPTRSRRGMIDSIRAALSGVVDDDSLKNDRSGGIHFREEIPVYERDVKI